MLARYTSDEWKAYVAAKQAPRYHGQLDRTVEDGVVLVGSDAHYWPGPPSTAHRMFCYLAREMQPKVIVMNGDVLDGASISRHPRIGWERRPTVREELDVCSERLAEIRDAAPRAELIWNLGNHDGRYELRLAERAPEYEGIANFTLKDHFPDWQCAWSTMVNETLRIKHRFSSSLQTNVMKTGRSICTGHLHSSNVLAFSDDNGTRWGVDSGCMADTTAEHFEAYMENNPRNWRSGFSVFTFYHGTLLWPQLARVICDGIVDYAGKVYEV